MKSRSGWRLVRETIGANCAPHEENLAVIIPSKRMTNKAVDDLVREVHLKEYGRLWPTKAIWVAPEDPLILVLQTPLCAYKLIRVEVYG